MRTKTPFYEAPRIRRSVPLQMESAILQTSIVEFIGSVESTGQSVHNFEWNNTQPYFNHSWDE